MYSCYRKDDDNMARSSNEWR